MRCGVTNQFAGHKSLTAKRDHGMNSRESAFIFTETGELYPVGTREYIHFPSFFFFFLYIYIYLLPNTLTIL